MAHYVCIGGCHGVAQAPGACETEDCPRFEESLEECNCEDGQHDEVFDGYDDDSQYE
jgi:hypothetical protein